MPLLKEEVILMVDTLMVNFCYFKGLTNHCNMILITLCVLDRKHRVKRSIKVPAISNKLADIPPDDYSWRKYGQKPIKGSPHPRYVQPFCYEI
jgi:hypothetical protein